jgi:PAS domain S-box-containing protein
VALAPLELTELLDSVVAHVAQLLEVDLCTVSELLHDGERLLLRAGVGWRAGIIGRATFGAGRDSQAGYTLLTNGPVILEDIQAEQRFSVPTLLHEHGVVSCMSVMIHRQPAPFGVLCCCTTQRRTFTDDDINFLQAVANVLATAIERHQAEEKIHLLNARLEQRVVERTAQLEATNCVLQQEIVERTRIEQALREHQRQLADAERLALLGSWAYDLRSGQVIWSDQLYKLCGLSPEAVNITFETFVACIHPDDRAQLHRDVECAFREKKPYSAERRIVRPDGTVRAIRSYVDIEVDARGEIARMVGTMQDVTEHQQAEQRVRNEAARAASLLRTAARLNAEPDLPVVLHAVCEEASQILDVPITFVVLFDTQQEAFVYVAGVGLPPEEVSAMMPIPYPLYAHYAPSHEPIVLVNLLSLPFTPNRDLYTRMGARGCVWVNMSHRGRLIGGLIVLTQWEIRAFTDDEVSLLQGLADQAAQAITNARLFEEVRTNREQLQRLTRQVVTAQEEERRRLSRELHDEASQALTGLEFSLQMIQGNVLSTSLTHQRIADAIALTRTTMDQLRHLAQALRPPALDAVGLNLTLEGLCRNFSCHTGLTVLYQGTELPSLPDATSITLYRFVQEALTNVARHAKAHKVAVRLEVDAEEICVSVADDGKGGNHQRMLTTGSGQGIGLIGMQERLHALGGRLEISTKTGQGTRLVAHVPYEEDV